MVESLEEDIRSFFLENPNAVYEAGNLSSYERLLAHACCSYNRLVSRSKEDMTNTYWFQGRFSLAFFIKVLTRAIVERGD